MCSKRAIALVLFSLLAMPALGADSDTPPPDKKQPSDKPATPERPAVKPNRRARPPKWDKSVTDAFLPDAREGLVGTRPAYKPGAAATTSNNGSASPIAGNTGAAATGTNDWPQRISAETLVDEIKAQQGPLRDALKTPGQFKGGTYTAARRSLSVLAAMFGIIADYDGDVRFKSSAARARDLFGRAGMNCKAGTDGSFQEARLRSDDLANLMRGEAIEGRATPEEKPEWARAVTGRPPLMQRLELAQQERLAKWTANSTDFTQKTADIKHEAEIVAALGEVIRKEGYEHADDETFRGYSAALQAAAKQLLDANQSKNYDAARAAAGSVKKSCDKCHGDYR